MLKLNLQFFAHKKGMGSTRNGRDSNAQRLGVKVFAGQVVTGGSRDGPGETVGARGAHGAVGATGVDSVHTSSVDTSI